MKIKQKSKLQIVKACSINYDGSNQNCTEEVIKVEPIALDYVDADKPKYLLEVEKAEEDSEHSILNLDEERDFSEREEVVDVDGDKSEIKKKRGRPRKLLDRHHHENGN